MELYQTPDNFIIQDGEHSLWCNRRDGRLLPRCGVDLCEAWNPVCRGLVYGVVGKLQLLPGSDWRLVLISKKTLVGTIPGDHEVFRIDKVVVLPLSQGELPDFELDECTTHPSSSRGRYAGDSQPRALQQTWNSIKSAATNIKGNINKNVNMQKEFRDKEKLERRILEEVYKMFNESDSFFYSLTGDLTTTLQTQNQKHYIRNNFLWARVDKKYFWNRFMLEDLINCEDSVANLWIIPIIQGYFHYSQCEVSFVSDDEEEADDSIPPELFDLVVISRRSIERSGTRYKRRGIDVNGCCANYVETEQIISTENHHVSFAQIRGSMPVYWSQPGYKYRPPPQLDKDEGETAEVFKLHFDNLIDMYKAVAVVNLVDQAGREKILGDAFMNHILVYNNPLLTYITFDFHEYCRGMKFENVSVLVESIEDIIEKMRYCWVDNKGIICEQDSVFRVNCMDCLDRTNVVQAAIARNVMETQLRKLGKLLPEQTLPSQVRSTFQEMWANNGDAISRQYAGTVAMKGDFTRTGERKFTGVMKDGYHSANRYYLNRFKAIYRQTVIEMMLGNKPTEEDLTAMIADSKNGSEEEVWTMEREECVAQLVRHAQCLLVRDEEEYLGGWALVDPFGSPESDLPQDQDIILLLTHKAYYIASYDDESEKITQYERVDLEELDKIEIGHETMFFRSKCLFIRIYRRYEGATGYFHTMRSIQNRTTEESRGILQVIAEAFASARAAMSLGLKITECKLDRKRSKFPPDVIQISSRSRLSFSENKISSSGEKLSTEEDELPSSPPPIPPRRHDITRLIHRSASAPLLTRSKENLLNETHEQDTAENQKTTQLKVETEEGKKSPEERENHEVFIEEVSQQDNEKELSDETANEKDVANEVAPVDITVEHFDSESEKTEGTENGHGIPNSETQTSLNEATSGNESDPTTNGKDSARTKRRNFLANLLPLREPSVSEPEIFHLVNPNFDVGSARFLKRVSPHTSDTDDSDDNSSGEKSGNGVPPRFNRNSKTTTSARGLGDWKSKLSSFSLARNRSPKAIRTNDRPVVSLSEEKERRRRCKTRIIEL